MNFRHVVNQLGLLILVLSGLLLITAAGGFIAEANGHAAEGPAALAFAAAGAFGAICGGLMWILTRRAGAELERREALLLVTLSWVVGAALAGLPFLLWAHIVPRGHDPAHAFASPVNCYFEAMSGLTTTGATILTGIQNLPRTILFWRGMTHWVGGLGIVVLFVAVFPSLGAGTKKLFRVEAGASREGVRPKIAQTARLLWLIYLGLTVAQIIALSIAGMGPLDATVHTFSSLAGGGFSDYDTSVGHFHSAAIDWIIIVFMSLGAVNFGLYYQLLRRNFRVLITDPEFKLYLAILFVGGLCVSLLIMNQPIVMTDGTKVAPSLGSALRFGYFQSTSIQTTTGFCTANFDLWPTLAKGLLVILMFIGGCAGSTAGGIKVIRIWIAVKVMLAEVERAFRPNVVRPIRVAGTTIDPDLKLSTLAYIVGIVVIFLLSTGVLLLSERGAGIDFATASTATSACLFTTGPGLSKVGAVMNYAWLSWFGKIDLVLVMLLGRLEVLAIIVLLSPRFWREAR